MFSPTFWHNLLNCGIIMDCGLSHSPFFIGEICVKSWYYILCVVIFLLLFTVINVLCKKKKPVKRAFLTMLFGVIVMFAVNIVGIFTGVYLPVSPLSLTVSSCLGIPGVASMLIISWVL